MDFIDQLRAIAGRIPNQCALIQTEEATKNAFVMPFLQALGYNVFDPTEVTPELTADVGIKKGEKVDYAILRDGQPTMLFECKWCGCSLDEVHASQLYRYFSVTKARIGVLTNGVEYRFFSDLDEKNVMDRKPFLVVNMLDLSEAAVTELKRLSKSAFDLETLLSAAEDMKYTREIKRILGEQLADPSEDFVRLFAKQVYDGVLTPRMKEQFCGITRKAFQQFIAEQLNARLKSALGEGSPEVHAPEPEGPAEVEGQPCGECVETTQEETDAFNIVRAIVAEVVPIDRVVMRDRKSHCAVLLDDSQRKPLCRLWFNSPAKKQISLFDVPKTEEKLAVERVEDLYKYSERLRSTARSYEKSPVASA
jgi:predicted type IV restriction endonuclease